MKAGLIVENHNFINIRTTIANVHLRTTKGSYTARKLSQFGKVTTDRFAVFDDIRTLMAFK